MKPIELEIWKPKEDDPRYAEHVGQRTAEEVFKELEQRLDSMGMLPDEYFTLDSDWQNGKLIPEGANVFVTTDYGESEGVYLDGYLKWYEDGKPVTKALFTGKTLGETGADLDRMFLISSAITKAFHGDHGQYARYMKLGPQEKGTDLIVNLTPAEQRLFIDALVERRERMLEQTNGVEQLLRRMTGSITSYMETVGERPLHISDYDKASLAIRDGELAAFKDLLPRVSDCVGDLLIEAAGRCGDVGRKMTLELVAFADGFTDAAYTSAILKAVEIDDTERVKFLMGQAQHIISDLAPSYYGQIIDYACTHNKSGMGRALVDYAPDEWIAAAPSDLLYHATMHPSQTYYLADALVKKGAPCGNQAWQIMNHLTAGNEAWMAEILLRDGLKIESDNYGALNVCVRNGALDAAKMLLDRGMDFDRYLEWTSMHEADAGSEETLDALKQHWQNIHPQEQAAAPEEAPAQGQTFGGLSQ